MIVFLEILGYTDADVAEHGFANLNDFARYIFDFIDFYKPGDGATPETQLMEIKSTGQRILEGIALAFPVIGMLAVLLISGVSLWMTRVLSAEVTTAFMGGVFLGILLTEGSLQGFNRLFTFYYEQGNIGEAKRVLSRNNYVLVVTLATTTVVLFLVGSLSNIPSSLNWVLRVPSYGSCILSNFPQFGPCHLSLPLLWVMIFSTITVAIHRSSYMLLFALKKVGQVAIAYAVALFALVWFYYVTQDMIPSIFTRYVVSLLIALAILSIPASYYNSKVMNQSGISLDLTVEVPHFYAPLSVGDQTILSRFGVQLWETIPYFVFGTCFFLMLFSDRIISWIFNPLVTEYGFALPLAFNSVYHLGADPALVVLLATTVVSYVLLSPIYERLSNMNSMLKVWETEKVENYLQKTYNQLLLLSVSVAFLTAFLLNLGAPQIMQILGGGPISLQILRTASIADIFFSIFLVNSMFLSLLNRIKAVASISVICAIIVVTVGILFGTVGFQYIIWAALLSAFVAMVSSTIYCVSLRGKFSSLVLGKYV